MCTGENLDRSNSKELLRFEGQNPRDRRDKEGNNSLRLGSLVIVFLEGGRKKMSGGPTRTADHRKKTLQSKARLKMQEHAATQFCK